ncbi:DUF1753-domain-containing protein [Xylona heveae TC161]|uniref:DUF1753-domain-containing protein n=1 Tax=Xylona heveae (strain CBS 132557 / TC161) TaxID=1328760 RepID=A0A165HB43_XYLHT|nr:DUF1753-domain-containing protein [Xylona heveae TC161]KZF23241.1 DUF1753-domain-containing protein [Xylona heveae TC161]
MGPLLRLFRLPRPKSFLYLMSLRTGTELITLSVAINKVSAIFGLLAILTGVHLSPMQLSMYIYSLIVLSLMVFLAPAIRKQDPLRCLALAWLYILDSAINAAYTAAFGVTWFLVLSQQHSGSNAGEATPGGKTMDDAAGFTNPKYNVSRVDVVATPAAGLTAGQDAVAIGQGNSGSLGSGVLQPESVFSITLISALWAVRLYFVLVVMAYARSVIRQHVFMQSSTSRNNKFYAPTPLAGTDDDGDMADNPFADGAPAGSGWQGRVGRAMVAIGRSYWLGGAAHDPTDDVWARGMGGKFRRTAETYGPVERERRRRSGTGPPAPATPLTQANHSIELQEARP